MEYRILELSDDEKKLFAQVYPQIGDEFDIDLNVDVRLLFKSAHSISETGVIREIRRQEIENKLNYLCERDVKPRIKELIVNLLSIQI
jgi:hypothetical protein